MKVLRPERVDDVARLSQRCDEQAELLLFLRHPGVVGVREHFEGAPFHLTGTAAETPGRWLYLVMNWVEGQPLSDWVMSNRDAPDRDIRILRHLEQAADVLDWLHSGQATPSNRPVVHGDLSPGNVMITPVGQAVLVDFGLIRLVTHHTQEATGTPGYAAPEVWLAGQYSPASDRYSFGAIAYFALTGTVPPPHPDDIRAGLAATPLLASAQPARVDQLMGMFSADPTDRPRVIEWIRLLRNTATTTASMTQHGPPPTWAQPLPTQQIPTQRISTQQISTQQVPTQQVPTQQVPTQQVPTQSTVPPRPRRRTGLLAAAVAAVLVTGVVIGAVVTGNLAGERATPSGAQSGRTETEPAGPITTTTTRTTPVRSSASATTSGTSTTVATIVPAAVTVRRQSEDRPLRLTTGYSADLDSLAPDWEVSDQRVDGADLYLSPNPPTGIE